MIVLIGWSVVKGVFVSLLTNEGQTCTINRNK